jgi:hypothetical protein
MLVIRSGENVVIVNNKRRCEQDESSCEKVKWFVQSSDYRIIPVL